MGDSLLYLCCIRWWSVIVWVIAVIVMVVNVYFIIDIVVSDGSILPFIWVNSFATMSK